MAKDARIGAGEGDISGETGSILQVVITPVGSKFMTIL